MRCSRGGERGLRDRVAMFALVAASFLLHPSTARLRAQGHSPDATLSGRVMDATTGVGVHAAAVELEGTALATRTDSTGRFTIRRVPPGPQVLRVRAVGYAPGRISLVIAVGASIAQDVQIARSAIRVAGIVVTADPVGRARGELGTATVIDRDAIRAQGAVSLAGVLELVPGTPASPPGLDAPQQASIRAVPTSGGSGVAGAIANPSAGDIAANGTLIVLDGIPLSNNANLQGTGPRGELRTLGVSPRGGIDLRRIPAATLDRVEVIRGLPSARYGDLTQGTIVIDTRAAAADPEIVGRVDLRTNQVALTGGTRVGDEHTLTLAADGTRTRVAAGLASDVADRLAVQVAHRYARGDEVGGDARMASAPLVIDSRIDLSWLFQDTPASPVEPGYSAWSRDLLLRWSERISWAASAATRLTLSAALDRQGQRSFVQAPRLRAASPFTSRLTEGREIGFFVAGPYISTVTTDGEPGMLYARLEAERDPTRRGGRHVLRTGVELRREWNGGSGFQFDMTTPPQVTFNGVEGFDRPRRYDDLRPLVTSAFYADDRLRWGEGGLTIGAQAGLRVDALHGSGKDASRFQDVAVQPRLNLEVSPASWLRLRGAVGRTAKSPGLSVLAPAQQYYDVVNVNWYPPAESERLAVLTTFVRDPTNPSLGFAVADKVEGGIELDGRLFGRRATLGVTAFQDVVHGAVAFEPEFTVVPRDRYQLSDSSLGTGRPPTIVEPPFARDTIPVLLDRPRNNTRLASHGIELTATLPEIPALSTRFEVQGAWVATRLERDNVEFGSRVEFTEFQLDPTRPRAPYWDGIARTGSRAIVTWRAIHHQPWLGLVLTASIQHDLLERTRDDAATDTLSFAGYVTRSGELVPVPLSRRGDAEFAALRRPRVGALVQGREAPSDWMVSFNLVKSLPGDGRLSFYSFNALDRRGQFATGAQVARLYAPVRYGLELTMPIPGPWRDQ